MTSMPGLSKGKAAGLARQPATGTPITRVGPGVGVCTSLQGDARADAATSTMTSTSGKRDHQKPVIDVDFNIASRKVTAAYRPS